MPKLGVKSKDAPDSPLIAISASEPKEERFPTLSISGDFVDKIPEVENVEIGKEYTATVKLKATRKNESESEKGEDYCSYQFDVTEMELEGVKKPVSDKEKETKMLGYERKSQTDKVEKPSAKDLEEI